MTSSTSGAGKTVLVTGGSGFIAASILNTFLSHGYHVRTTVRNDASADKVKQSHKKYIDQLSFVIVKDLETPGGHDEAVKGVDGVIHTASPFILEVEDNERDLLKPAVNGTLEVLNSVYKHNPNVKRIVITSSFAAILDLSKGDRAGYTYTEADYNPISWADAANPKTSGEVSYCASKAFAEKAAFDFVKEKNPNFQVTSIDPPMVYGPSDALITNLDKLNTSSTDIYRLMNGSLKEVPKTGFYGFVDVRDVAEAHLRAYESEKAAGQRYFTASSGFTFQQICDIIRRDFPEKRGLVPEGNVGEPYPDVYRVDNSKTKADLGIEFRSLEDTIRDMVTQFIAIEKKTGKA